MSTAEVIIAVLVLAFAWGFLQAAGRDLARAVFGSPTMLAVGPNDVLLIKHNFPDVDGEADFTQSLLEELARVGLRDRSLVISEGGTDVVLAVVPRDDAPVPS